MHCRYELYDPCTVMFFYRNKHMMIDLGTGNNNKINWAMEEEQEFIDIVEVNARVLFASCEASPVWCLLRIGLRRKCVCVCLTNRSLDTVLLAWVLLADSLPRRAQGTWSRHCTERLLNQVPLLITFITLYIQPILCSTHLEQAA